MVNAVSSLAVLALASTPESRRNWAASAWFLEMILGIGNVQSHVDGTSLMAIEYLFTS